LNNKKNSKKKDSIYQLSNKFEVLVRKVMNIDILEVEQQKKNRKTILREKKLKKEKKKKKKKK